jgi:TnpA family transposase
VRDPQTEQLEAITRDPNQDRSQRQRLSAGSSTPDTHGASVVGFAFTELLGFKLLPRLKNIGSIRLYSPEPGQQLEAE